MPRDYTTSSMTKLVKDCTAARYSREGYMSHPATAEIFHRLPPDLLRWFARVMFEQEDPLALRCGPKDRSDKGFFEIWRAKRDRDHPDLNPDYTPPPEGPTEDGGDGGAVAPTF